MKAGLWKIFTFNSFLVQFYCSTSALSWSASATQESRLVGTPPPLSNLCGLPDDRPDFTWAQAINALTLDFNQAICLRTGTVPARPGWLRWRSAIGMGDRSSTLLLSARQLPSPPRRTRFFSTQGLALNCRDPLVQIYQLQSSFSLSRPEDLSLIADLTGASMANSGLKFQISVGFFFSSPVKKLSPCISTCSPFISNARWRCRPDCFLVW